MRAFSAVTLLLLFVTTTVAAGVYHVHTYTEIDGLPSTSVWDAVQTADGRMWFATRKGIAIYDGRVWSEHGLGDGLLTLNQRLLHLDEAERIWAISGSPDTRISVLEPGRSSWETLPPPPQAVRDNTTAALPFGDGSTRRLFVGSTLGVAMWDGEAWTELNSEPRQIAWIHDLAQWENRYFVASNRGLSEIRLGEDPPGLETVDGVPSDDVRGLAVDATRGGLWLVGDGWVGFWDGLTFSRQHHTFDADTIREGEPMRAVVDPRGDIVFGGYTALFRLDPKQGIERLGVANGLVSEGARGLLVDAEGLLWVCSERGVSKLVSQRFANYTSRQDLLDDEVSAVLERADGSIVLGHGRGLTFFDSRRKIRLGDPMWARVLDLAEDSSGSLWIASYRNGLYRMDPSGEISRYAARQDWRERVNSVLVDQRDRVWIATNNGLFIKEGERFVRQPLPGQVFPLALRRLFRGAGPDRIYVSGIGHGLWGQTTDGWKRWTAVGSPGLNNVYAFLDRGDGAPWVGTTAGLAAIEGDRLVPVELPSITRPIYFMVEDREKRIWFGTDNGVLVWDGEITRHLSVKHGLAGRETNRAAGLLDSKGQIWIGTDAGLSVFRPEFDRSPSPPPDLRLLGVEVDGEPHPGNRSLRLGASQNALSFTYRPVSFIDEDEILVRTRLDGLQDAWDEPERPAQWESHYHYLPPGTYRFEIQAANVDGRWSEIVASAPIVIAPPFWSRWWFYAAVLAVAALLGYVVHRSAVRQRLRIQREADNVQKIRSLGFLAGGIAHDFNNLLTVVLGNLHLMREVPDKAARDTTLDTLETACLRARDLTDQLLTFSRGGAPVKETGQLDGVICDCVSFALSGANVRYEIDLVQDLWPVDFDNGQISQVLNNVLINAVQAMPEGGDIRIRARNLARGSVTGTRVVEINIEDTGSGIPEEAIEQIFDPYFSTRQDGQGLGLATAHSIVRRHDGELTVTSVSGQGTTFRIRLPASDNLAPVPAIPERPTPERRSGGRVLVVDDDADVRSTIEAMLRSLDYEVVCAAEGGKGLDLYGESLDAGNRFDAVILDLTIRGGMGGRETIGHLLELDPDAGAIVVSGYSSDPVMADFEAYGFRARVSKPFLRADLQSALEQILDP